MYEQAEPVRASNSEPGSGQTSGPPVPPRSPQVRRSGASRRARHGNAGSGKCGEGLGESPTTYEQAETVCYTRKSVKKDLSPEPKPPHAGLSAEDGRHQDNEGSGRCRGGIEESSDSYEETVTVHFTRRSRDIPTPSQASQRQQTRHNAAPDQTGVGTGDGKRQGNSTRRETTDGARQVAAGGRRGVGDVVRDVMRAHLCCVAAGLSVIVILGAVGLLVMVISHMTGEGSDAGKVPDWSGPHVTPGFVDNVSIPLAQPAEPMMTSPLPPALPGSEVARPPRNLPPVTPASDDVTSVPPTLRAEVEPMTTSSQKGTVSTTNLRDGSREFARGRFCDCAELYKGGFTTSGVYRITLQNNAPVEVYCDMDTDGGGWTVIQRRIDGTVPFNSTWAEYKRGFGNTAGEHWLGNDNIHLLTNQKDYRLRIHFVRSTGKHMHITCTGGTFKVADEKNDFRLDQGVPRKRRNNCDTIIASHIGCRFSTVDRDNDNIDGFSCAECYGD
ncbi:hypothetical protein Bbelb_300400 [Branchiostoma belcheri]|nr:hypothetical protein Bbelb_300400 [Branchiostoma belcheri]